MWKNFTFVSGLLNKVLLICVLGLLIVLGLLNFRNKQAVNVNLSQAAVIKQIQELQRLETAQFTIEKIIDAKTNGNVFEELLFGDKILLIAHGEVIAGFDLGKIDPKDIQVKGTELKMKLPAPEILVTTLDNQQTRVYDRTQGLLSKGQKDLETTVRQAAQSSISQAACEGQILDQATENGRKQLTALFSSAGFTKVELEIPAGSCQ
jgi:type II secretory pathway pseudopilin PulG